MPRTSRVRSMASLSFALPSFARCDRPSAAFSRAWAVQPGRFAQGPEEKHAFAGRVAGFLLMKWPPFQMGAPRWGEVSRRGCYMSRAKMTSGYSLPEDAVADPCRPHKNGEGGTAPPRVSKETPACAPPRAVARWRPLGGARGHMHTRRRILVSLAGAGCLAAAPTLAQTGKTLHLGAIAVGPPMAPDAPPGKILIGALADRGYAPGRNLTFAAC